jgi:hypothetical protein
VSRATTCEPAPSSCEIWFTTFEGSLSSTKSVCGRGPLGASSDGTSRGLGIAVYHWLIMRQGVDTVKPDVHVRRFAEGVIAGRS